MKTLSYFLFLVAACLQASPALYEGFDMSAKPRTAVGTTGADAGDSSAGWLSSWQMHEGESKLFADDLQMSGLLSTPGTIVAKGKTVAMRQMAETFVGDVYGSFRMRANKYNDNSMMGLLFTLPGQEEITPKSALLAFMPMRWASPLGSIAVGGKIAKAEQGQALDLTQTALVLWKIENLPEPGKSSDQVIRMWVLSEQQVTHFAKNGMPEKALSKAETGTQPDQVLQSIHTTVRNSKLTLVKGLVISCFSYGVNGAFFDEIRISRDSLADAAGVGGDDDPQPAKNEISIHSTVLPESTIDYNGGREIPQAAPGAPDIVFVLVDDLRWDALSFLGHPYVQTPNVDKLREQGAWMENAFVSTSICCPSRATFLTGTYASRHGVIDNETSEYNPDVTPPLTKYLQEAGYRTAMIGKWHMGNSGAPRPYFDFWLSFKGQGVYNDGLFNINGEDIQQQGYTTDLLTEYAINFIGQQPKDRPYFVMLSHKAVHEPFQPAQRHTDAFGAGTELPEPVSWSDDFAGKPAWLRRQQTRDARWHYRTRNIEEENLPDTIAKEPWKKNKKYVDQLRCLAAVDDGLGRVIEVLRERGTLDNTLIVFTSDNGYFHLEHRRWDKRLAYEESLRIPMIVVYPGKIHAGSTVTQLVNNADFAPTVLSYAGLDVPSGMQGTDMRPLFEEEDPQWRDSVFYEYKKELVHAIPTMTAVRTEQYKLITFPEIDDIDELYDVQSDPHEMNNLAQDPAYASVLSSMRGKLQDDKTNYAWDPDAFPKNLPRIRGREGVLLDLAVEDGKFADKAHSGTEVRQRGLQMREDSLYFDGDRGGIQIPFTKDIDPAAWPFRIDVEVRPESDGVIAVQSTPGYGYKLFVQDGRPGVSVHCKTWIDTSTTIDGPESVLGKWTRLQALIDYNRLVFLVDGVVAETVSLPLPFKGSPKAPLMIGSNGEHPVVEGIPDDPFSGEIRRFTLRRAFLK